ncbi:MAG: four helix bundle protein [Brumimicrobium sp.]|nr:four helix bundle protein [Brumimicrobium sp.]
MIKERSIEFSVWIIETYKDLTSLKEYTLSKQLLRSGTAIGALISEAEHAQSKRDFLNKINIALKEANETLYWLLLLKRTNYLTDLKYERLSDEATQLVKILASIVKTTKERLGVL